MQLYKTYVSDIYSNIGMYAISVVECRVLTTNRNRLHALTQSNRLRRDSNHEVLIQIEWPA